MSNLLLICFAFLLTELIECGITLFFKSKQLTYTVFLCNLLTNPLLNLILVLYVTWFGRVHYLEVVLILEVCVVIVEAFIINLMMQYKRSRAILLSLLINVSSYTIGLIIMPLIQIKR